MLYLFRNAAGSLTRIRMVTAHHHHLRHHLPHSRFHLAKQPSAVEMSRLDLPKKKMKGKNMKNSRLE